MWANAGAYWNRFLSLALVNWKDIEVSIEEGNCNLDALTNKKNQGILVMNS